MKLRVFSLGFVGLPLTAAGHHSHAEFSAEIHEVVGELTSVVWRNPHPAITLRVADGDAQGEIWRIQVQGNVNGLSREGVTGDRFRRGDRVRIAGQLSTRRPTLLLATRAELADGTIIVLGPDESTGSALYRGRSDAAETRAPDSPSNIFRVWTVANRVRTQELPLNDAARLAKNTWDPVLDDPQRDCRPLGMPGAMMSPHPIEIRQVDDDLVVLLEEWNARRTIHMASDSDAEHAIPSPMGYSVGRWDDDTLVVTTTQIDYPYMDEHGTPQTDAVEVVERFSLSTDGRSLDWEATVTDPGTMTEPVIAFTTRWAWLPGEYIQPYDCQELDPL
ncbi:MAG: DUF6152 family protein [Gammaproteobacteria bacterium]